MKGNVSVVRLIVATRSSGPPASGKIIKDIPGSVASGTPYTFKRTCLNVIGGAGTELRPGRPRNRSPIPQGMMYRW
jgi:hypothetical protein